jgi:hypothetical protein
VSGNTASSDGGGAISVFGTLTLTNSTVSGNTSYAFGGGIDTRFHGTLILTDSTVTGNSAAFVGGGMFLGYACTVTNSTISSNSAPRGGGIANEFATLTVTNSTVSGNFAQRSGGGIANLVATLTVTNSTVSGNLASLRGGGVYNVGSPYYDSSLVLLRRSLFSGNTAPSGAEVFHGTYVITVNDFNLFGQAALTTAQALAGFTPGATNITATTDGTTPTALSAILDPTLADNGGPTSTQTLVTGSPALDASPADSDCPPIDQRGVPRPQGAACDIGAVELVPGVAIPTEVCGDRTPTTGCTVNGQDNQLCFSATDKSTIIGTPGPDVIVALGKNNTLKGGEGDDCIIGGPGKDRLEGEDGNDVLFGGGSNDQVRGGKGNDLIVTDTGDDKVQGDEGGDLLFDSGGTNTLKGRGGDDVIVAPGTAGVIDGGSGTDECIGGTEQKSCP